MFFAAEPREPLFVRGLTDLSAVEGEPVRLEAQVAAFPTPEVHLQGLQQVT